MLPVLMALVSCVQPLSQEETRPQNLEQPRVPFPSAQVIGLNPQVSHKTGLPDYSLEYRVSEDGQSIVTRYMGPGETLGTPLSMRAYEKDGWHYLLCAASADYQVILAKWKLEPSGKIVQATVRTEPFVEWRALGLKPYQLVSDVEWRPLIHGVGVGDWRRN